MSSELTLESAIDHEPWIGRWEVDRELVGGGQGSTHLVRDRANGQLGVLKLLRDQDSEEARRRMFKEVNNLLILADAGARTPALMDSNTDQFAAKNVTLFFVMEYVEGKDLGTVVRENDGLPLDQSIEVTLALLSTCKLALENDVIHRDLKPANIIVRSLDPIDVVIVDYGLSFNTADDEDLTRPTETLDNKFLSMPERRVPGGDRRDPRSDLTGLCGVLYFCVTGHPPVDLVDGAGTMPHRRVGHSVREKLGDDPRVTALETFLDRGFAVQLDARFQMAEELELRLRDVLEPGAMRTDIDPREFARESAAMFLRLDTRTQRQTCRRTSKALLTAIRKASENWNRGVQPFSVTHYGDEAAFGKPADCELLDFTQGFVVAVQHHELRVATRYRIGISGTQCCLYRRQMRSSTYDATGWEALTDWVVVVWFDGLVQPDPSSAVEDVKACVTTAMQLIRTTVLGS